jgi:inhibitor of the pro-sigma K processing machinery
MGGMTLSSFWPIIFIVSCIGLAFFVLRFKPLSSVIKVVVMNIIVGMILVYIINTTGWINGIYIPINYGTIAVVGLLGVPGVVLLIALKLILY